MKQGYIYEKGHLYGKFGFEYLSRGVVKGSIWW